MIRVFVEPTGLHSRGMVRITRALKRWAPAEVEIVRSQEHADLIVMYVIGANQIEEAFASGRPYAAVQCCLRTAGGAPFEWKEFWNRAEVVWSYYDLLGYSVEHDLEGGARFYYAPLGVDPVFHELPAADAERRLIITTGYVSGVPAEPIEQVWLAAERAGVEAVHVGPTNVYGMTRRPRGWRAMEGVSDQVLLGLYRRALWVSGLRHVEGFELPAVEGLACGARPIVFDQPAMRHWYGDHAEYLPELQGEALVGALTKLFTAGPCPVSEEKRRDALRAFDWRTIATGFWGQVLAARAEREAA